MNKHTGEPEDLCRPCREVAFEAAESTNYPDHLVISNMVFPEKRNMPDE